MKNTNLHPLFIQGFLDTVFEEVLDKEINQVTVGIITSYKDCVATVIGLDNAMSGELVYIFSQDTELDFELNDVLNNINTDLSIGMVFNLQEDLVGILILEASTKGIKEGDIVYGTNMLPSVNFSSNTFGKIVNPLGDVLDDVINDPENMKLSFISSLFNTEEENNENAVPIETKAPGVILRQPVNEALHTGVTIIDSLIPIGRGQRELIIGDKKTGKTSLALSFMIQQAKLLYRADRVFCIYVAIGQKQSSVKELVKRLKETNSLENTIVVSATAAQSAALQYIAPYAGVALGEYFRDRGFHALVIFDDLTKHANAYREISLNLRRPPGREAYPGDVFYLHSRLLERCAKLSDSIGGGSLTGIPIVETQAGDVSAYIPTNVISITDGQIVLSNELFANGVRPAVDLGLSVSRVGSAAQPPLLKYVVSTLKLELAQYRDTVGFTKLSTDLDPETKRLLHRGKIYEQILIQRPTQTFNVAEQVILLYAAISGYFDEISVEEYSTEESYLLSYINYVRYQYLDGIETDLDKDEYNIEVDYSLLLILEKLMDETEESLEVYKAHEKRVLFLDSLVAGISRFLVNALEFRDLFKTL
jgi:proton translocating ATP synthase F1 alpha subunit